MTTVINFNCLETKEKNKKAARVVFKPLNQKCILHELSESPRILALRGTCGVGGMHFLRQEEGTTF